VFRHCGCDIASSGRGAVQLHKAHDSTEMIYRSKHSFLIGASENHKDGLTARIAEIGFLIGQKKNTNSLEDQIVQET
jgi:hypothetical protein